jgi:hypothetical protein
VQFGNLQLEIRCFLENLFQNFTLRQRGRGSFFNAVEKHKIRKRILQAAKPPEPRPVR